MFKQLPDHLFLADDGDLHDTRREGWHKQPPLRSQYSRTFSDIKTTAQFKATLRAGPYTWPGGYQLALACSDGGALCFECARNNAALIIGAIRDGNRYGRHISDGWRVDACYIADYMEDVTYCDHCYKPINPKEEEE